MTYPLSEFEAVRMEFENRNARRRSLDRPDHEELKNVIYEMGRMQGKTVYKEYPIENGRLDVAWKRIRKRRSSKDPSHLMRLWPNLAGRTSQQCLIDSQA